LRGTERIKAPGGAVGG